MNVTMLAGFLIAVLGSIYRRQVALLVSLLSIFVYVGLSGFEASIIRAAFMAGIAFSANLFGRQYSGLYVLILVGFTMLLWDPVLLTDVGFQLSVLATGGILVLKPSLFGSSIFPDDIGTTLSAQLATLPVLLATFGQYSLLSIVANVMVLWTIPLVMTGGVMGIIIGLIFAPLGKIVVWAIIPILWYLQQITLFFSAHSISVHNDNLPIAFIGGYYIVLMGIVLLQIKKAEKPQSNRERIKNYE